MIQITGGENWIGVERVHYDIHASADGELWCSVPGATFDETQYSVADHTVNRLRKEGPGLSYRILKVTQTTRFDRVAYYPAKEAQ